MNAAKFIRDGQVAVLVSPSFGVGWSTGADEHEADLLLFEPDIVEIVLNLADNKISRSEAQQQLKMIFALRSYTSYMGSVDDLEVEWVDVGTRFRIHEYDGSETLMTVDQHQWHVA